MDPRLRASDAEREQTVATLRMHVADGRITMDEFSDRSAAAYDARTLGDLAAVTADLPPTPHAHWEQDGGQWKRPAWLMTGIAAATAIGFGMLAWLTQAAAAAGPMMSGLCH